MVGIIDDELHLEGDILEYDPGPDTAHKLLQTRAGLNLIDIRLMIMIMMMIE